MAVRNSFPNNERFGTEFTEADQLFLDAVEEHLVARGGLEKAAQANSLGDFELKAGQVLADAFVDRHTGNAEIVERFFADEDFKRVVTSYLVEKSYGRLRGGPTMEGEP